MLDHVTSFLRTGAARHKNGLSTQLVSTTRLCNDASSSCMHIHSRGGGGKFTRRAFSTVQFHCAMSWDAAAAPAPVVAAAACFASAWGAGIVVAARLVASACSLCEPFFSSMPALLFISMPLRDISGPCTSTLSFPTLFAQAQRDTRLQQDYARGYSGGGSQWSCACSIWFRKL